MLSSSSLAKKSTLSSVDGRDVGSSSFIGAGERILLSLCGTSSKMSLRVISFEDTERLYHSNNFLLVSLMVGSRLLITLKLATCVNIQHLSSFVNAFKD